MGVMVMGLRSLGEGGLGSLGIAETKEVFQSTGHLFCWRDALIIKARGTETSEANSLYILRDKSRDVVALLD